MTTVAPWQPGDVPAPVGQLPFHELANLFPLIEGDAFDDLMADIAANGLQEPIELLDGAILDGRNRYRAALAVGATVHTRQFRGSDPLAYVMSRNLHRRQLSPSQRAIIAARVATMRQGERTDLTEPSANLRKVSQGEAARAANVSDRSVTTAREVLAHGSAELVRAVEGGRVSVSAAADIASLPIDQQKRLVESVDPRAFAAVARQFRDRKTAEKKAKRAGREAALAVRQRALPEKRFGVIYADPEWQFEVYSRETGMDRAADNHYPTSPTNDIVARPVGDIAAKDSVLFLWATAPMIKAALRVMEHWGFTYKAQFIWLKDRISTGFWNRNKHELLLVGTRGDIPAPAMGEQWPSVIEAPVGEHSAKPEIFAEMIEAYYPNLPKIELNARRARPGWDVWGLEAPEAVA
ncbi:MULTISPECIES: MT-A70 family methyltransferase [Kaistia]|uniref:MT-A70 family methyltransferase n=1 Tax=Kaistia nematophila TaxID=2994654 RepID=A0A9X3ILK0_9HYPH|nr:MT-A70 family methyltransferase [Kaistia nematophila]MCX5570603.1 MT-A70 family methyltransferase [Kaistia nematophila]